MSDDVEQPSMTVLLGQAMNAYMVPAVHSVERTIFTDLFDPRPVYTVRYSPEYAAELEAERRRLRLILEDLADEWGVDLHENCEW